MTIRPLLILPSLAGIGTIPAAYLDYPLAAPAATALVGLLLLAAMSLSSRRFRQRRRAAVVLHSVHPRLLSGNGPR